MRLLDSISIVTDTSVADGYGGYTDSNTTTDILAKVSVSNDELRSLPNGYGYYKKIAAIVEATAAITINSQIVYDGVTYTITRKMPLTKAYYDCYLGYEV